VGEERARGILRSAYAERAKREADTTRPEQYAKKVRFDVDIVVEEDIPRPSYGSAYLERSKSGWEDIDFYINWPRWFQLYIERRDNG